MESGQLDNQAGIRHLRAAFEVRPTDPAIAFNLAMALSQHGDHEAAFDVVTEDIAKADPTMRLSRVRAFLAQETGRLDLAAAVYEAVLKDAPHDWGSWNNLGNTRRLAGDAEGSLAALERAMELCPTSPPVRLNYASVLASAGRIAEAEDQLRSLAQDYPRDTKPLQKLHAIMAVLRREVEALEAIEEAVRRDPTDIKLLMALASQRLNMLQTGAAEDIYRQVIQREPAHKLANLGLAVVLEISNRTDELAALIGEIEERGVGDDVCNFVRAMDHLRERRFAEGLEALAEVPEELEWTRRYHLLGQLEEGAGNYEAAFTAYSRNNEILIQDPTHPVERALAYRNRIRRQIELFTPEWLGEWRHEMGGRDRASPVFLVGFPRSGTTLLDTMLMGHPAVEVLEEEPALLEAKKFLPPFEDFPNASEAQIEAARDAYFQVAGRHVPLTPSKLLIDKNPLSMNLLPIVYRLFPNARIIRALRHPCDAVFSCYAANFELNDAMSNFLRLDTAAELYDLSFTYFDKARDALGLPVHEIVYENLVTDSEGTLRSLVGFLGLEWSDAIRDHQATAQSRGRIKTASYAQVGQPIYSLAAGRWMNFRKHLEPVLPILQPWAEKFGYTV